MRVILNNRKTSNAVEDIRDEIMEEDKALSMYTDLLHSIDVEEDREIAIDLIHIRNDEKKHKQILHDIENSLLDTKQSYLKDRNIAIKNGHKVNNELDDFIMWCGANKFYIFSEKSIADRVKDGELSTAYYAPFEKDEYTDRKGNWFDEEGSKLHPPRSYGLSSIWDQ